MGVTTPRHVSLTRIGARIAILSRNVPSEVQWHSSILSTSVSLKTKKRRYIRIK